MYRSILIICYSIISIIFFAYIPGSKEDFVIFMFFLFIGIVLNKKLFPNWYQDKTIYIMGSFLNSVFLINFLIIPISFYYTPKSVFFLFLLLTIAVEFLLVILFKKGMMMSKTNFNKLSFSQEQLLINYDEKFGLIKSKIDLLIKNFDPISNLVNLVEKSDLIEFENQPINNWFHINDKFKEQKNL